MNGWIDEITDGIVWGRVFDGDQEFEFNIPVLLVGDDQRVELEPGRYCSIVNGELLIDKTIWTTRDKRPRGNCHRKCAKFLDWTF
jgi:hypothetical protein